ncbi:MAG TPA: hypothetical protein VHX39_16085, partial [Acetobacteraceae bacterium]|nr:hypothetical protein [Acetobacteraceae bacterium]
PCRNGHGLTYGHFAFLSRYDGTGPRLVLSEALHETEERGHTHSAWLQCEMTTLDCMQAVCHDDRHVEPDPHHAN